MSTFHITGGKEGRSKETDVIFPNQEQCQRKTSPPHPKAGVCALKLLTAVCRLSDDKNHLRHVFEL